LLDELDSPCWDVVVHTLMPFGVNVGCYKTILAHLAFGTAMEPSQGSLRPSHT